MAENDDAKRTSTGEVDRIIATLKATLPDAAHPPVPPPPAEEPEAEQSRTPRREPVGVLRQVDLAPPDPAHRWNPGARYRASRLAALRAAEEAVVAARRSQAEANFTGPVIVVGPGGAPQTGAQPALAGRLYRGPARRVHVFDREIWSAAARSNRTPRDISEALTAAVERYRKGAINTTGLVRAIGHALAA
ncbi:hypothetical protein [Antribacter gilvus]|uniref:hypothetical protein n=1 Tax=Antribacter gilvus TaxID=2304675 RepID=UPI000F76A675|nr:hypothetical protein [Antribacter gilvus]